MIPKEDDLVTKYFVSRKLIFLLRYLGQPKKGERLLDLGCGRGTFTEMFHNKGYDAVGIDLDPEYKNKLTNRKAKYLTASAESIPFPNNSFDVILLLDALEHINNKKKALSEINRILKPEGKAIIAVPNILSYFYARSFLTYTIRGKKPWTNIHYHQDYFLWKKLISGFLKIIDIRPILVVPFFEPKLIKTSRLSNWEFNKKSLAWISATPVIICKKKQEAK